MRNHGDSDHYNLVSYKDMAEDIIQLVDKLNVEKFTLLGHSMGGKAAITIASMIPHRLDGLIILDVVPVDDSKNEELYAPIYKNVEKAYNYDIRSKSGVEVLEDFKQMFVKVI